MARFLFAFVGVLLLAGLAVAQTTTLDEDDKLALTLLSQLSQQATKDCQALDTSKAFQTAKARVEARLKAKHGLTIDQAVAQVAK